MRISDWSSDVCSSDLDRGVVERLAGDPAACRPGRDDDARHTETGADRQVIDKFPRRARGGNGRRDMIEQPIILVVLEDEDGLGPDVRVGGEIGRASCRERVCKYV